MFENLVLGFQSVLEPMNILVIIFGVIAGVSIGALPGLTSTMGVVLLLPFTFAMEPTPGILSMIALYCGTQYGGAIPGILFNVPGTSEAAITSIEGYPLTKKGKAGQALGTSVIVSSIGGLVGVIILVVMSQVLAKIAISFAAPEYFCLSIFGFSMVINLKPGAEIKNLIGGLLGLFLATVGTDLLSGYQRFSFGLVNLTSGISFIPVMIGLFAITEVFRQAEMWKTEKKVEISDIDFTKLPKFKELWNLKYNVLRSILIGFFIGALPAAGSTVATFIAYNEANKWSRNPEMFGKGTLEGISAAESANNAGATGALLPTMILGIPGSAVTAVILGALMIHGMRPGPLLLIKQPKFVYSIFVGMGMSSIVLLLVGVWGVKIFAQMLRVPANILNAVIIVLCVVGSYALKNNTADLWVMLITGILGYLLRRTGFSPLTIVIGLVLGQIIEISFRQTMILFDNNLLIFILRPYSLIFLILTILGPFWQQLRGKISKH